MPQASKLAALLSSALFSLLGLLPLQPAAQSQPGQAVSSPAQQQKKGAEYRILRDVNLVVLHATVLDERGRFVPDLKPENFRVFEDKVEQGLAVFKREDIPVSVGLVIDNSGSMRDKREKVNAAALTFVKTSNPQDEVFVVNFNDDFYLDKDFTSDINELKEALERIDARGSTALYDAIVGSLDHLKKGTRDKKVLLVVTDGEDNASRIGGGDRRRALERTMLEAQKSDAAIYTVGLLGTERKRDARRAREALTRLAQDSGGLAFFPETMQEVEPVCTQIAHDLRNQYTLGYYPTNTRKDGTFRAVQLAVIPPRGRGKLTVRTRTGYYAQRQAAGS
jgi:VWFA-related protein